MSVPNDSIGSPRSPELQVIKFHGELTAGRYVLLTRDKKGLSGEPRSYNALWGPIVELWSRLMGKEVFSGRSAVAQIGEKEHKQLSDKASSKLTASSSESLKQIEAEAKTILDKMTGFHMLSAGKLQVAHKQLEETVHARRQVATHLKDYHQQIQTFSSISNLNEVMQKAAEVLTFLSKNASEIDQTVANEMRQKISKHVSKVIKDFVATPPSVADRAARYETYEKLLSSAQELGVETAPLREAMATLKGQIIQDTQRRFQETLDFMSEKLQTRQQELKLLNADLVATRASLEKNELQLQQYKQFAHLSRTPSLSTELRETVVHFNEAASWYEKGRDQTVIQGTKIQGLQKEYQASTVPELLQKISQKLDRQITQELKSSQAGQYDSSWQDPSKLETLSYQFAGAQPLSEQQRKNLQPFKEVGLTDRPNVLSKQVSKTIANRIQVLRDNLPILRRGLSPEQQREFDKSVRSLERTISDPRRALNLKEISNLIDGLARGKEGRREFYSNVSNVFSSDHEVSQVLLALKVAAVEGEGIEDVLPEDLPSIQYGEMMESLDDLQKDAKAMDALRSGYGDVSTGLLGRIQRDIADEIPILEQGVVDLARSMGLQKSQKQSTEDFIVHVQAQVDNQEELIKQRIGKEQDANKKLEIREEMTLLISQMKARLYVLKNKKAKERSNSAGALTTLQKQAAVISQAAKEYDSQTPKLADLEKRQKEYSQDVAKLAGFQEEMQVKQREFKLDQQTMGAQKLSSTFAAAQGADYRMKM